MTFTTEFPSDLRIARKARLEPLEDVASGIGIGEHLLEPYGESVAKIKLDAMEELADRPKAKYVLVSAITPTSLGEGKTTTTVGLGQAFRHIGRTATVAIRQPSMGRTSGSHFVMEDAPEQVARRLLDFFSADLDPARS